MKRIQTLDELLSLDPAIFYAEILEEEEILRFFELCDAAWYHSGDSKDPHAVLTSNLCSNGFFDSLRVLRHPTLSEILATQLAKKIRASIGGKKVDWVIGSPMAGITFSHDVARALGATISMFVEKDPNNSGKMLWNRMAIPERATVLQVEELTTTSKTLNAVQEAVNSGNPNPVNWLPYVGILVHRPPLFVSHYGEREVISLINKEVWAVPQTECILCQKGSERVKPKTNWNKLTGKK
jgi:hypothetical protein